MRTELKLARDIQVGDRLIIGNEVEVQEVNYGPHSFVAFKVEDRWVWFPGGYLVWVPNRAHQVLTKAFGPKAAEAILDVLSENGLLP